MHVDDAALFVVGLQVKVHSDEVEDHCEYFVVLPREKERPKYITPASSKGDSH